MNDNYLTDPNSIGDPIQEAVTEKSVELISKGLQPIQQAGVNGVKVPQNAAEAIYDYLDEHYKSFSANADFSYTSMNIKDTQHFVKTLDQAYKEIESRYPNIESLNSTLADFLTSKQLSVLPTGGMLKYYQVKNMLTTGAFTAQGFANAGLAKQLPVAARHSFLLSGPRLVGTSFLLGSAFSILEDITPTPWKVPKIAFNSLKWLALMPARGAEAVINMALGPLETMITGVQLPVNGTKALISGPGLTIKDISRKEVKAALNEALKRL